MQVAKSWPHPQFPQVKVAVNYGLQTRVPQASGLEVLREHQDRMQRMQMTQYNTFVGYNPQMQMCYAPVSLLGSRL